MPIIISSPEQAAMGIERFTKALEDSPELQARLPYARAWYVLLREGSEPLFGPSKYIGYRDMDASTYLEGTNLNGRETERVLSKWYEVIEETHPMYAELFEKLTVFLGSYGKSPSTAMRFNMPKSADWPVTGDASQDDISLADLLISVAQRLPSHQRKRIREALS